MRRRPMANYKYKGFIHFHDWKYFKKKIENCIVRENDGNREIIIDYKDNDNDNTFYSVKLIKLDKNNYKGELLIKTNHPYSISCRCYSYENKIAIIGEWAQSGQNYYWNCELEMESEIQSQ
jgi:hypothetical protein